ncbi:MAG: hypothetical protein ACTSWI_02330 [Alphaproteobacteria bacterium]
MPSKDPSPTLAGDLQVRVAAKTEGDNLRAFLTRAATDENIDRFDVLGYVQEFVLPLAQIEAGQLFVVTRAWAIVGLASVVFRQEGGIELDALLIDPTLDTTEAGGLLIEQCRSYARSVAADTVHATVAEASQAAMVQWGFESLGVEEAIVGSVALKMRALI